MQHSWAQNYFASSGRFSPTSVHASLGQGSIGWPSSCKVDLFLQSGHLLSVFLDSISSSRFHCYVSYISLASVFASMVKPRQKSKHPQAKEKLNCSLFSLHFVWFLRCELWFESWKDTFSFFLLHWFLYLHVLLFIFMCIYFLGDYSIYNHFIEV